MYGVFVMQPNTYSLPVGNAAAAPEPGHVVVLRAEDGSATADTDLVITGQAAFAGALRPFREVTGSRTQKDKTRSKSARKRAAQSRRKNRK